MATRASSTLRQTRERDLVAATRTLFDERGVQEAGVEEIARAAGWKCFVCNRGPFHVIEVWVENETMVEILPPEYAKEYLAFTRPDKVQAAMSAAGTASARHPQG